ncbi:uncharacterized protein ofcc1 [Lepisosteus oculatus]|uniref:uncharacterized protein ofcc1 n=1 Tax=Lepisosteus oculatus TaxID=7918 RepID=UPI003714BF8B
MDKSDFNKFQQKALKQPKQKKSKSDEFLMGEGEERAAAEGIENPAFNSSSTDLSAYQASEEREMKDDRQDSTLAAHQQKTGLHVHTKPRGNERTRNYFDPPLDEEINPRRYGAEGSTEDELELKLMRENDKELYHKMSKMLEDAEATVIDLPGALMPEEGSAGPAVEAGGGVPVLSSLRQTVHDEVIPCYDEHFKECVQDDMIALGSLSLEQEAWSVKQKRLMLGKEQGRGKRLMSFLRGNKKELNIQGDLQEKEMKILHDQLYAAFQQAESQLLKALKKHKGEVTAKYGELTESGTQSNREQGLRWQVGWSKAPQPVEIQIRCLRGVRDKLPKGRYALRISLYSRLGGQALRWSKIRDHQRAATTSSVGHGGNFYDSELQFTQSVFIVLPAPSEVQPEMILLFEMLSGENTPSSDLFGWGAFPVCDCRFEIVEGQFKCPLLRGQPDPAIDQFQKIEDLMSSDLDNWLCNLYFQVKKLPRCDPKHQEYEVTLQIPQACQSPDSLYTCWVTKRHQKDCNTKESHLRSQFSLSPHYDHSLASQQGEDSRADNPESAEPMSNPILGRRVAGMHGKKKPAQKRKSKSPSPCHEGSASSLLCGKETAQSCLCADELDEYRFSLQSRHPCRGRAGRRGAEHTHFVLRALLSELGLSQWRSREFWLIMLLLTFIWFLRLYLHYCSQWLFLQAISVPVNKFQFCLHTVKVVYQNSLLHTREELAMVVVGPLTLNVVMLLMVLIRWGCQLIFGSLPSLLSKFIMAMGVWTVLDPLAVFAVDAILGHLAYSAEEPIADVMKLYWHFHRTGNSAVLGIMITLFLYVVLFICSCTTIYIYFLRLHNNGRILDVFLRLHSKEGAFFIPHDLEVSNQELNYIVKKAEQWRGIHGERRKVAVYDYIWTKDPSASCDTSSCDPQHRSGAPGLPASQEEISTHVSVYTIHLSGLRKPYRQFLREPDGAIVEVPGDAGDMGLPLCEVSPTVQNLAGDKAAGEGSSSTRQLRGRKKKAEWRSSRVEPAGRSWCDSTAVQKLFNH